jgi:polysaccharide biosynthesis transport protein
MEADKREQESALRELTKEVRDQEDKVEESRKVVFIIAKTKGIILGEKSPTVTQTNTETREEAVKRSLDLQDYLDAMRDFETNQEYLKTMKLKLLEMNLSHKMADSSVVIHDEAVIAEAPISPNVSLNLTLGLLLGFLLSPLMALPVIWVMNRVKPEQA